MLVDHTKGVFEAILVATKIFLLIILNALLRRPSSTEALLQLPDLRLTCQLRRGCGREMCSPGSMPGSPLPSPIIKLVADDGYEYGGGGKWGPVGTSGLLAPSLEDVDAMISVLSNNAKACFSKPFADDAMMIPLIIVCQHTRFPAAENCI